MTRRVWVVLAAVWFTMVGWSASQITHANDQPQQQKSVYLLKEDLIGMPFKIVLRPNCFPAEDTMAKLILVDYSSSRAVYRCHTNY